jgi:hypothetical protein
LNAVHVSAEGNDLGGHPPRGALRDGDAREAEHARRHGDHDQGDPAVDPANEEPDHERCRQLGQRVVRDTEVEVGP